MPDFNLHGGSEAQDERNFVRSGQLTHILPGLSQAAAGEVIDLMIAGRTPEDAGDLVPGALLVEFDPMAAGDAVSQLADGQSYIVLRDVLQHCLDYRGLLREAFAKLREGGHLIITTPHQFMAERKFRLPSRYGSEALRFYTAASLLAEVEEAIDPVEFRLRTLIEDDAGYDYAAPIDRPAVGHQRLVLVLERIARPHWAEQLTQGDDPVSHDPPFGFRDYRTLGASKTYRLISSNAVIERIFVLKTDHRGDLLLADPALRELRSIFPAAHITYCCGSWNVAAAQKLGLFDHVEAFDQFPEDASAQRSRPFDQLLTEFEKQFADRSFDLAIDLRQFDDSRPLLQKINAAQRAGFDCWSTFDWLDIRLDLQSPSIDGSATQSFIDAQAFRTKSKMRDNLFIDLRRPIILKRNQPLVWGPYHHYPAGEYHFEFLIMPFEAQQSVRFEICADGGKRLLTAGVAELSQHANPEVRLTLHASSDRTEFRLYPARRGANWRFSGIRWRRSGRIVGVHQREAMFLLIQLVRARLADAFTQEVTVE